MKETKMSKKQFWIRFSLYVLFGGIIPFVFLVWRFDLFKKVSSVSLSIGGWGIIAIIFVSVFLIKLISSVREGLPFSLGTQILDGLVKIVIPLAIMSFFAYSFQDIMDQIFQFLMVVIICELVAIPINPIPTWSHENKIEESTKKTKSILKTLGIIKDEKK